MILSNSFAFDYQFFIYLMIWYSVAFSLLKKYSYTVFPIYNRVAVVKSVMSIESCFFSKIYLLKIYFDYLVFSVSLIIVVYVKL